MVGNWCQEEFERIDKQEKKAFKERTENHNF